MTVEQLDQIRIFVAATPAESLPVRVLEFSIQETTKRSVHVTSIYTAQRQIPMPKSHENRPRTPFSFQRFLIPELCKFRGRAIYLDADMQVFSDIAELWEHDLNNFDLQTIRTENSGRRGQFSVLLLNCEKLNWDIDDIIADLDSGALSYDSLMYEMRIVSKIGRDINPAWNSLEKFHLGTTRLLHYTDMNIQPWISTENPLAYLWVGCLRRAINANFISLDDVSSEIKKGHVRPSLMAQLESEVDDSIVLPSSVRKLDQDFLAPYHRLQSGSSRPWTSLRSAAAALLRRKYYQSPLARLFR